MLQIDTRLSKKIMQIMHRSFSIDSHKEVAVFLFRKLNRTAFMISMARQPLNLMF